MLAAVLLLDTARTRSGQTGRRRFRPPGKQRDRRPDGNKFPKVEPDSARAFLVQTDGIHQSTDRAGTASKTASRHRTHLVSKRPHRLYDPRHQKFGKGMRRIGFFDILAVPGRFVQWSERGPDSEQGRPFVEMNPWLAGCVMPRFVQAFVAARAVFRGQLHSASGCMHSARADIACVGRQATSKRWSGQDFGRRSARYDYKMMTQSR